MVEGDDPAQPVVITALFGFSSAPPLSWVTSVFATRLAAHPRFRATLTRTRRGYTFTPLPPSSPSPPAGVVHAERAADPEASPADRIAAFHARVSQLASASLAPDKPPWRLHFFPGFYLGDPARTDAATVVLRVHHGIGDGLSLVKYCFMRVADKPLDGTSRADMLAPRRERERVRAEAGEAAAAAAGAAAGPLSRNVCGMARRAKMAVVDALGVYFGTAIPDSKNPFNSVELTTRKFVHFIPPDRIPLADLKAAARRLGVTVNAVLFASLTGAVREYLRRHDREIGADRHPARFHAALAFNMQKMMTEEVSVNNLVVLLPVRMRIEESDAVERLKLAELDSNRVKVGYAPFYSASAFKLLASFPRSIRGPIWKHLTRRISCIWTNVPGPPKKVQVDGRDVDTISFAAPADGHGGVIFSLFSYNGLCSFSLSGDSGRVAHPEELASLFLSELQLYLRAPGPSADLAWT